MKEFLKMFFTWRWWIEMEPREKSLLKLVIAILVVEALAVISLHYGSLTWIEQNLDFEVPKKVPTERHPR